MIFTILLATYGMILLTGSIYNPFFITSMVITATFCASVLPERQPIK